MSLTLQRSARGIRLLLGRDTANYQSLPACRVEFSSESADGARRVVAGLNVLKSGKDPEELKDEDVPEWLWKLADEGNGKSLMEMERRVARVMEEGEGQGDVVETMREAKFLSKLQNRSKIRGRNALKAKK